MQAATELIRALATLLWPVLVFVAIVIYRRDIKRILGRLLRLRIAGQEVELDRALDQLQSKASIELSTLEPALVKEADTDSPSPEAESDFETRILEEAARSPRAVLMLLAAELEREAREVLLASGWFSPNKSPMSLRAAVQALDERVGLARGPLSSLSQFLEIRNTIVHGRAAVTDAEILRAIDIGLTIMRAIRAVPHETHFVDAVGIELFEDSQGKIPVHRGVGVLLRSVSPGGTSEMLRIFPTTRTHFPPGMKVAWEWSPEKWGETWYRDPESGEIKQAWQGSLEFAGRDIDSV